MPPLCSSRNDKSLCDRLLVMWTKEEDDILRDQVKLHGIDKWAKIATHLCGKTSRQCRRRWHMFLNVVNKRGGWSADEDKLLLEAHRKFGNRWTEIAKKLPGRTDNAVKNRFCVLCKKQTKEAEVSPLQRSVDSSSDDTKKKLPERRFLEGPKAMLGSGANKKMRTESNHRRTPDVVLQQRPLEETLQQWKGLQSSEISNSPHRHGSWDSLQSNILIHQHTQETSFQGWMGLALDSKGRAVHPQMHLKENLQRWEGSESGAVVNDSICPTSSMEAEPQPLLVLQSLIPSLSPSGHSRLMQENLQQQWKSPTLGEVSNDCMHQQRVLTTSHSTWCGVTTTDATNELLPQPRPVNELLQLWKGMDKNMLSNPALQQRDVNEAFHHWEQNSEHSISATLTHHRSVDENLPPLAEMNSFAAMYMSNSKQCTLVSGMQRWSTMQPVKGGENVQQSSASEMQVWGHSLANEAKDNTSHLKSKEDIHGWQDWNCNEVNNQSPCQHRLLEHNMQTDDPKPEHSPESISFQSSVKHLPEWTSSAGSQQVTCSTAFHKPEGHSKSQAPTRSPHHLAEDAIQQWDKSESAGHSGPLVSTLNRFPGSASNAASQLFNAHPETQREYKSQLIEESWKTAIEKLKCAQTTCTADTQSKSPREVLEFEEYMSRGPTDSDHKATAVFPPPMTSSGEALKADNSKWEMPTKVKDAEDGEMNAGGELLPENSTTCESGSDLRGGPHEEVELMKIEGQASGETESPLPDIPTDGAHSPTQIVPRSHITMESMPSPQFSDSEKEFLLSTLDQTTTNCWSSSPLRPQSRFSKVRNPLIDIRYDTPARSPLSSCLLRQFQVSEASHLA